MYNLRWNRTTKSQNDIVLQNNCKKSKNSDVLKRNWFVKFKALALYIAFKMMKRAILKTLKYNLEISKIISVVKMLDIIVQ